MMTAPPIFLILIALLLALAAVMDVVFFEELIAIDLLGTREP